MFSLPVDSLGETPRERGRVIAQDRGGYIVATSAGELRAAIDGKLRHSATSSEDFPVVGDYVALDIRVHEGAATIRAVLRRANLFARRAPGGAHVLQPIAANLDTLFVCVAVDGDFNLRRVERYLVGAAALGVPVALALTKTDLAGDPAEFVTAAQSVARDAPVVALSATTAFGLDALAEFRGRDKTLAFVGSSGVGKSTLVNALLQRDEAATGAVRAGDDRGRHTTTRRELFLLDDGTAVIDTPGMREFALADADLAVDATFDDVTELAAACRFNDCRHESEPGCAVREAVDEERLQSWRKLRREAAFEARKTDPALARAEQARWKAIHRANRVRMKERGR